MSRYRKLDKMRDILNDATSEYISDSTLEALYEAATDDSGDSYREMRSSDRNDDRLEELERKLSSLQYKVDDIDERLG